MLTNPKKMDATGRSRFISQQEGKDGSSDLKNETVLSVSLVCMYS